MFGVCYYPEHWPESVWPEDAKRMASLGLRYIRIGEFAWSRLEPDPGRYEFDWLDRSIAVLNDAGLEVVLGTPTATPPKWLIDQWPEILPVDPDTGRTRGFGSRRHYDFSSEVYLRESLRITRALAERYGDHGGIAGWQTDNELCCHDTTLSASPVARDAFQSWCERRYETIDALNEAWGNVFWSMEYRSFAEIELPVGAVTETSPAHQLAWRRFSSDQVVRYHDAMVEAIRKHAREGQFVTHNFIPTDDTNADDFALAKGLDFASFDNYPLGRTDLKFADASPEAFRRYMRTGHPDFSTWYFDQTRGLTGKGFWVMEQQPGPVNWARSNPRPAPGMIRLWTLEAFAHGADCVSWFRWRQAPFAQEQMHAGLLRPDHSESDAWPEIERAIAEAKQLQVDSLPAATASVALLSSVESQWLSDIEQQGAGYDAVDVQFRYYSALRRIGVDADVVSPAADLSSYDLVIAPALPVIYDDWLENLKACGKRLVIGPRSGAKTEEFGYPASLPPGPLQSLIDIRVTSIETLREDCPEPLDYGGKTYESLVWRECIEAGDAEVVARYEDDGAAVVRQGRVDYLGTLTDDAFLRDYLRAVCEGQSIETRVLDEDLRIRRRGDLVFAFNYGEKALADVVPEDAELLLGERVIGARDLAIWRT